ncbi:hypothetical protein NDA11_001240 [Ustilago hordei]|uniref:Uncharacterized protein n=1 Tax=Ustilago hordei TaxID=120017 RepID=I2G485_USTHO|nr:uncharacterized protein UHO2_01111 [Ustilago hordei]KAJ1583351.1 hypothetical protein NDA15_002796 [Ustilago hordei]KAJ1584499.1 hypothetical protein NDA11_001240 [Ustilago hordei]KAJ1592096.1 hypothetical protein NDA12_005565 [Ustilago hordei]CCF53978.1 uncharacterized protein UHOR_16292 [Ustilago hordei]SYW74246.1 uncharacterized protein UHO2_01111 [Ustilago hordei]
MLPATLLLLWEASLTLLLLLTLPILSIHPAMLGPKVMVILEDNPKEEANHKEEGPTEEESHNPSINDQEGSNLIQQPSVEDYGEDYDEDDEGNISGTMH